MMVKRTFYELNEPFEEKNNSNNNITAEYPITSYMCNNIVSRCYCCYSCYFELNEPFKGETEKIQKECIQYGFNKEPSNLPNQNKPREVLGDTSDGLEEEGGGDIDD